MFRVHNSKFRKEQKHSTLAAIATAITLSFFVSSANLSAASETNSPIFDQDMLDAVANLYGISEEQAVDRLAKESEAALDLKYIKSLSLKSFAGSWFDASSMKLNVAIADSDDLVFLKVLNVEPVLVSKSLMELQEIRRQASDQLKHMENQSDSVHLLYIDFRTNKVVLGLSRQFADSARL